MDPVEIPDFLVSKSLRQLAMISGLNINNIAVHKSIYAAFQNIKRFNYKLLPPDESKPKNEKLPTRNSSGVLKQDWALKYLNVRPALIVLFVDFNFDDSDWAQKRMECESKIASLRQNLSCRETRIVLVLIQDKSTHLDDHQVKERGTELCSGLQLTEKQLFVFPKHENHDSVALRLDNHFYEFSQHFYQSILRKIRSRSIPNNYANLLIRQQFKLAFLSEMRHDTHSALRIYKQAYQNCAEAEIPDTEFFEYMSVLSLLNYKICELSFQHNIVHDALNQFRKHMLVFAKRPNGSYPSPQLAQIEILKWKSKQCKIFACLFIEAIANGLVALAHENPGLYFEKAGDFQQRANEAIMLLKSNRSSEQIKNANQNILHFPEASPGTTIYFGQRPWRVKTVLGTLDPLIENAARLALEEACQSDYKATIQHWSMAIRQFQQYSCNRMLSEVRLKIAEECFYLREFSTALNSIQLVISKFHKERTPLLLKTALLRFLDVAFCRVDIHDYFWALTQLLNPAILYSVQSTSKALNNFLVNNYNAILNSNSPMPSNTLNKYFTGIDLSSICEQWQQALSKQLEFSTNFSSIEGHLQVSGAFLLGSKRQIFSGQTAFVQVTIQNLTSTDLFFSKCRVLIDERGMSRSMTASHSGIVLTRERINVPAKSAVNLLFSTELSLPMPARQESSFYIKQILLDFSSTNNMLNGLFKFDKIDLAHQRRSFETIEGNVETSSIRVLPVVPKIELRHLTDTTIFLDEVAVLKFALQNQEPFALQKVSVTARQLDTDDEQPEDYEFPSLMFEAAGGWQPRQTYEIASELASGSEIVFNVVCKAKSRFKAQLQLQVTASAPSNSTACFGDLLDHSFSFTMFGSLPFLLEHHLLAINDDQVKFVLQGHRSILECDLSPNFSGEFYGVQFNLNPEFVTESLQNDVDNSVGTITKDQVISRRQLFRVTSTSPASEFLNLGKVLISWKRSMSREVAQTRLNLEMFPFRHAPLLIEPSIPNNMLIMRQAIKIDYFIKNLTTEVVEIKTTVERAENDYLMFDGFAERKIILLPQNKYNLILTVVALKAGVNIQLPRLKIKCNNKQVDEQIQSLTLRYIRSNVFVAPASKDPTPQRSLLPDDERSSRSSRGSSVA
ncbi:hypothetical protein M3Y97_00904800 [Aphelenchoides bicaudatus]|nr:hypothetical protein M3Y97_00904800 [Aphelenchoides bicaudatus]